MLADVMAPRLTMVVVLIAFIALMVLATWNSRAGRLSRSIRAFRDRPVELRVWGEAPPQMTGSTCRIETIRAFGAGLHLFVTSGDARSRHLKIAQPAGIHVNDRVVEIRDAAYVQWMGRRQVRVAGRPALRLALVD